MTKMQLDLTDERSIKLSILKVKWAMDKKDIIDLLIDNTSSEAKKPERKVKP